MDIKGEVKLYEAALHMLRRENEEFARLIEESDALKEENARLKDRCDVLERSFGDTAALEHTVAELQERNDSLRLRVDVLETENTELEHKLSGEVPLDPEKVLDWKALAQSRRLNLIKAENELEKYKVFARAVNGAIEQRQFCSANAIWSAIAEEMKEHGYEITDEARGIPEFGSSGSEDNSKSQDEHDFL